MLPRIGNRKICRNTATETQVGKNDLEVIAPSGPKIHNDAVFANGALRYLRQVGTEERADDGG